MKTLKLILVLIAILVSTTSASAYEVFTKGNTEWTATDTVLQSVMVALLEVDRRQTRWIAENPRVITGTFIYTDPSTGNPRTGIKVDMHGESNSMIGPNASAHRINTYFIATAAGHTLVAVGLRKSGLEIFGIPAVTIWQSTWIGIESNVVRHNIKAGVKINF